MSNTCFSRAIKDIARPRCIVGYGAMSRLLDRPESTVRGWYTGATIPGCSQIVHMKSVLCLTNEEYLQACQACQFDLIQRWRES